MSMSIPPMVPSNQQLQQRKKYSIAEVFGEDDEGDEADGLPMDESEGQQHKAPGNQELYGQCLLFNT